MRIRVYQLILAIVLILSALVIGLRGTNPQTTAYQVGGLQTASSVKGVALGPTLWSDSFTGTGWHLSNSNTTQISFLQKDSLNLNATFTSQLDPESVVVARNVNISLSQNPLFVAQLTVSQGVHYGIRFSGTTPDGSGFSAWTEEDPLQHRPGLGSLENVSANLSVETYMANGQAPVQGSRITGLWFYVEATAGTSGTYSMRVASVQAISLTLSPPDASSNSISGSFQGIVIDLNVPEVNQSLFQAYVDFNIHGSSSLRYTPYLMQGTSVLAQGYSYSQNSITSYESAVLTTTLVSSFPNFLPGPNSTAIVIAANSGSINQFSLSNISLKYTSTPIESAGFVDPDTAHLMIAYYFVFLFVTPITITILVAKVFSHEN